MIKTIFRLFLITALVAISFTWVKAGSFDLAFSASSGKSGDAFEIYSESLTSTNNIISYMTSDGRVLTTSTIINSWVKNDGRRFTTGVFPILIPGDYYIKVTNSSGLESNTAGFTLLSGGIYPKIEPATLTTTAGQQLKINTTNIVAPYKLTMYIGAYEVSCQPDYYACNATVPADLVGKVYVSAYFNNYHVQSTQQVEIINPNLQQPVIDYITPTSGPLGTTITVYGKYFNTGLVNSAWNGVSIEPVNNAGTSSWNWQSLDVVTNDSNKLTFTIGANLAPGLYNISVTKKPVGGKSNYAQFNLTGSTGSMSFVSLNYGKDFTQGQDNFISWNGGKTRVMVGLVGTDYNPSDTNKNTVVGWITLVGSLSSSVSWNGKYLVDVNGSVVPEAVSGEYRLILVSEGNNGNYCTYYATNSQNCNYILGDAFYLAPNPTTSLPAVQALSPNGGETWNSGQTVTITWKRNWTPQSSSLDTSKVTIDLISDDNSAIIGIATGATDTGSYSWTVPQTIVYGTKYRIRVGTWGWAVPGTDQKLSDISDGTFIVNGPSSLAVPILNLSLHSESPLAQQITTGQQNIVFGKFILTASVKDVRIRSMEIGSDSLASKNAFTNVRLVENNVKIADFSSFDFDYTNYNGRRWSVINFDNPLTIPVGTSKTLVIMADASVNATGNLRLGIVGLGFNETATVMPSGVLPIYGSTMSIGPVTSPSPTPTPTPTPSGNGINLPDGTVLKLPGNPTVYLVTGGQLKPFSSAEQFLGQGYKWTDVQQVNPSQTANITGFYPYPSGSLVNDDGTVYFIGGHIKVPFTNYQAFVGLGYSFLNVIEGDLTNYALASNYFITTANAVHPWGSWVIYKGTVYYSTQDGMIGVASAQVFTSNGGNWNLLVKANSYDIAALNANPNLSPMTLNDSRVQ